jgi:hypothetical protein
MTTPATKTDTWRRLDDLIGYDLSTTFGLMDGDPDRSHVWLGVAIPVGRMVLRPVFDLIELEDQV